MKRNFSQIQLRTVVLIKVKVKVKWSRYRPGVAQRVGRGIALLFHDRSSGRGWVVSSTPRPHFTPGIDPVPIVQEAGWVPGPVWTGGKSHPHRDSIPDHPARSQSLYRLSYPAHTVVLIHGINAIFNNKMPNFQAFKNVYTIPASKFFLEYSWSIIVLVYVNWYGEGKDCSFSKACDLLAVQIANNICMESKKKNITSSEMDAPKGRHNACIVSRVWTSAIIKKEPNNQLENTDMHCLITGIHSEERVVTRSRCCVNVIARIHKPR